MDEPEDATMVESELSQGRKKQTNIITYTAPQEEDAWDENFAVSTADFDTTMMDAE